MSLSGGQDFRDDLAAILSRAARMIAVIRCRGRSPVPLKPSARVAAGRRVNAARLLAGDPPLFELAQDAGMSFAHLRAVVNGVEPLTSTDVRDLAVALDVPPTWLQHGWDDWRS